MRGQHDADRHRNQEGAQQVHVDRAARLVRGEGADRRRNDDGERRADRDVHAHALVDAEHAEDLVEDGHQDGAAADPENAGQQPRHHARGGHGSRKQRDLARAHRDVRHARRLSRLCSQIPARRSTLTIWMERDGDPRKSKLYRVRSPDATKRSVRRRPAARPRRRSTAAKAGLQHSGPGPRARCIGRQDLPESPRARLAMEQADHVAGDMG